MKPYRLRATGFAIFLSSLLSLLLPTVTQYARALLVANNFLLFDLISLVRLGAFLFGIVLVALGAEKKGPRL